MPVGLEEGERLAEGRAALASFIVRRRGYVEEGNELFLEKHTREEKGTPSRAEMTDAAMSERAECVMLNKGPYVAEAVTILDHVLARMQDHQVKKTPQLRALHMWQQRRGKKI